MELTRRMIAVVQAYMLEIHFRDEKTLLPKLWNRLERIETYLMRRYNRE